MHVSNLLCTWEMLYGSLQDTRPRRVDDSTNVVLNRCVTLLSLAMQVSDFVKAEDPVRVLTDTHVLEFGEECQVFKDHRATTAEIQHLCSGTIIELVPMAPVHMEVYSRQLCLES